MLKHLKNNKGSSLLGAVVVMVVLAAAATTVVNLTGSDSAVSVNHSDGVKALAYGNGGIQWGLEQLANGVDPTTENKSFDNSGSFSIVTDPANSMMTVTSTVGNATKTQSINANFSQNCVDDVFSTAIKQDSQVFNISLDKDCNNIATLTKMTVTWDWSACAVAVGCDADDAGIGNPPNNKFWICHVPPGQPENAQTLAVNQNGWDNGHSGGNGALHNQDYIGPCTADLPTVTSCAAGGEQVAALATCNADTQNATVTQVDLNGATIFQAGAIPNADTAAAASGTEINLVDSNLTDNDNNYLVDLTFSTEPPSGAWYTVRFDFADGSYLQKQFRAGDVPDSSVVLGAGFEVSNGTITVENNYNIKVDVIGSQMTCGNGGAEINVTTQLCIDNNCSNLFNGADVDGGETYNAATTASDYVLRATGSLQACNNFSTTYASTNTLQVKTLVAGDTPPAMVGWGDQQSVAEFLEPYLDVNGNINIDANQAIMLFEIGTNMSSDDTTGADFQDLVTLITITQGQ